MAIILTPEEIAQYRSAWANTKVGVRNFSQSSKSEVEGKKKQVFAPGLGWRSKGFARRIYVTRATKEDSGMVG